MKRQIPPRLYSLIRLGSIIELFSDWCRLVCTFAMQPTDIDSLQWSLEGNQRAGVVFEAERFAIYADACKLCHNDSHLK